MIKGRDTSTFRIDRHKRQEIIRQCSHPALLIEIFQRADALVFTPRADRRAAIDAFHAFCHELPCIRWQPEDPEQRHITVTVTREPEQKITTLPRIIFAITHPVIELGEPLRGDEEVLHTCGVNGVSSTGYGVCLNPAHLLRGNDESRTTLASIRRATRRLGLREVRA